jgi:hypothetical protein
MVVASWSLQVMIRIFRRMHSGENEVGEDVVAIEGIVFANELPEFGRSPNRTEAKS